MLRTEAGPASIGGRREQRKSITRRELLAAGRRLFSEKGLYESRIEDLTRTAGVAKGTIYGYFGNKEELIQVVAAAGFAELQGRIQTDCEGAKDPAGRIERLVLAHVYFFHENNDLMRIFHQMRGMLKFNRPEWRPLRKVLGRHLAFLAAYFADVRGGRPPGARQRQEAARFLFGSVSGIMSVTAAAHPRSQVSMPSEPTIRALVAAVRALIAAPARARRGEGA